jgi:ATP-dependent protease ClpP protease subunit
MNRIRITGQASAREIEVLLYGDVGQDWFGDGNAAVDMQAILADNPAARVKLRINSSGGDVFEGVAMHALLSRHAGPVDVSVDGLAASAASLVAMAGNTVEISQGAMIMVHNASAMAVGNAAEIDSTVALLRKVDAEMAAIYAKRSGQSVVDVQSAMDAETWYTAAEAVEFGLADMMSTRPAVQANFKAGTFRHPPAQLTAQIRAHARKETLMPTEPGAQSATDVAAAAKAATIAERERIAAIQAAGSALKMKAEDIDAAIKADVSADDFRARAIAAYVAAPQPADQILDSGRPSVTAGEDQRDKTRAEARDWLYHRSGMHAHLAAKAADTGYKNHGGGQFRGMTLMEMARQHLRLAGVSMSSLSNEDVIRMSLSAGYQHTSDFPIALEGVIHQEVLRQFALVENITWRDLAETGSQNDFRETSIYRRGSFGRLEKHQEGAEIRNKNIPDSVRERIGMSTVANIIAITRETMINDNLGLVLGLAGDIGYAAALSVELDFYAMIGENSGLGPEMADGKPLLHVDHKNVASSSALSIEAIDADAALFAEQTDISGNLLSLEPTILWLPRNLRGQARKINRSMVDFTAGESVDAPNPVEGQFDKIVATTRLKSTAPRRYTLASPMVAPVFRVQFLNGQQTPMLDRKEGFRTLGTEWSIVYDYECGVVAHEGIQTNAGS